MQRTKAEWIEKFRKKAYEVFSAISENNRNKKIQLINRRIKLYKDNWIGKAKRLAEVEKWDNEKLLNEILMITYASYIVMLEYRNKVWEYDYMSFSRRIGELWEPFCKLPFEYPMKKLTIIEPLKFKEVQENIKQEAEAYFETLKLSLEEKRLLSYYYKVPWRLVDSGEIQLSLDLHFEQDGIHYNCDFKSGFSSNEKGNTNRLLLVASIYQFISENEKTLLFVRQDEDSNNHYLQTLKNSGYWNVYCADDCYKKIAEFTGFDLRVWLDKNIDWKNDISIEFRNHLEKNKLLRYLTW